MARTIDSATPTQSVGVVKEEKKEEVTTETVNTEEKKEVVTESKIEKNFNNSKMKIKCESLKGKSVVSLSGTIAFDEKGIAEVEGVEAKRLLTIPGYELVK